MEDQEKPWPLTTTIHLANLTVRESALHFQLLHYTDTWDDLAISTECMFSIKEARPPQ
jgi:hypothetical protein